ncbi:hypothetical protein LEN26_004729, partial [Aphanomyces euteiches]
SSGFESTVPSGYFYLADSGLGLSLATLTPFRRTRYHLREWATTPQGRPQTSKELFNYRHSKARIVVERAFGLLKMKWKALSSSSYDLKTTILIIHVCAALHNFAIAFSPNYVQDELSDADLLEHQRALEEIHEDFACNGDETSENWRDQLANRMWSAYQEYRVNSI